MIIKITEIIFDNSSALIAGILISIHPLCVAFNSRIFTNNLATLLFYLAFYFLLKSLYKGGLYFEPCKSNTFFESWYRKTYFILFFFIFGYLLTVRDTFLMFSLAYLYVIYKSNVFFKVDPKFNKKLYFLSFICILSLLIGFSPSLYFNYKNFGNSFTFTHAEYGASLDFRSLFFGMENGLALPGLLIMVITIFLFILFLCFF